MKTNTTTIAALALVLNTGLHADTKTVEMGSSFLGAKLTGNASGYSPTGGGYADVYSSATATGTVLWKTLNLGGGAANLRMSATGNYVQTWGYLKAAGKTLTSWNKTVPASGGVFSTAPIVSLQKGGDISFLGIIDLGMDVNVTLKSEGVVTATTLIGGGSTTSAAFGPVLDAVVSGDASVNIGIASGGIIGSVKLCHADLTAKAAMRSAGKVKVPFDTIVTVPFIRLLRAPFDNIVKVPFDNQGTLSLDKTLTFGVDFNSRTMDGKFILWGDSPFISKKTKTYSWSGFSRTLNLTSGSFNLTGTPILIAK